MTQLFIDNKYTLWYFQIIHNAKKTLHPGYTELHHIIPKSFFKRKNKSGWLDGNPDTDENLVRLTAKEHFICHLLLTKMTQGIAYKKTIYAAKRCRNGRPGTPQYVPSGRVYQIIKEQWNKINPFNDPEWQQKQQTLKKNKTFTEKHKESLRKSWTPERKKIMSARNKGVSRNKTTNKGKKMPQLSGSNNGFFGKVHSTENREKARLRLTGKAPPWYKKTMLCEYCGKEMDLGNFTRYHGPKCKLKN
jgi:hypothetical protein